MKLLSISKPAVLLSFAVLFSLPQMSFADSISWTPSGVSSTPFNPSSDSLSWNAGSGISNPAAGVFTFQTGDFEIGDSEIPDQDVPFTLLETVTLNGITRTLRLSGDDNVTRVADTLTLAASLPVYFGGEFLTVQPFSLTETNLGDFPVTLEASISPAPEPGAVLLLGTGALCAAIFGIKRTQDIHGGPAAATPSEGEL